VFAAADGGHAKSPADKRRIRPALSTAEPRRLRYSTVPRTNAKAATRRTVVSPSRRRQTMVSHGLADGNTREPSPDGNRKR
jgi:hypothetical protein